MKRKIMPLSLCVYILSAVLMICGILSVIACHQNISAQLSQGVPVKGNELAILNLYLQSAAQYLAYSALLFAAGRFYQLFAPPKLSMPPQPDEAALSNDRYYQVYREEDEEEDGFQNWDSNQK